MTQATLLLQRPEDTPLAWLNKSLNGLAVPAEGLAISNRQFLTHVRNLAERLPDGDYAINLCDNRYLFMVAALAVVLAEQTNLLPSNKNKATQENLYKRYQNAYALHDGEAELPDDAQSLDLSAMDWSLSEFVGDMPRVDLDLLAIISFTSGSTGESKPNLKTWRTLQESSRINAQYMLPNTDELFYHLATVPGQHMWGLETSVLLPVFANACLVDARPLYPHDILTLLHKLPAPRTVIGTPLHLRALSVAQENSKSDAPKLANVLCATAPLDQALAKRIEGQFSSELREVYGCSEVGSMAVRRTAKTDLWSKFEGLNFVQSQEGETLVSSAYLPNEVTLGDTLEMMSEDQFRLSGRVSDQVKIAGKRGSLHEVNSVLGRFPGLLDGIVFFPPQDRAVPRLVAIVCLTEDSSKEELRAHFKTYLDSAFVPRPIFVVGSLPREDNGKLMQTKLHTFYRQLAQNKLS